MPEHGRSLCSNLGSLKRVTDSCSGNPVGFLEKQKPAQTSRRSKNHMRILPKHPLCLLLVLLGMSLSVFAESSQPIGKVLGASGEVNARDAAGAVRHLARKSDIFNHDTIITGDDGVVQIRMADDARFSFKTNTEFAFNDYSFDGNPQTPDTALMSMAKGGFRAISGTVGHGKGDNYRIDTPYASIGIRGTTHEAVLEGGMLYTGVYEGGTTISNNLGSIDTGIRARYDFTVTTPGQPPEGLLVQPKVLGNLQVNVAALPTDKKDKPADSSSKPKTETASTDAKAAESGSKSTASAGSDSTAATSTAADAANTAANATADSGSGTASTASSSQGTSTAATTTASTTTATASTTTASSTAAAAPTTTAASTTTASAPTTTDTSAVNNVTSSVTQPDTSRVTTAAPAPTTTAAATVATQVTNTASDSVGSTAATTTPSAVVVSSNTGSDTGSSKASTVTTSSSALTTTTKGQSASITTPIKTSSTGRDSTGSAESSGLTKISTVFDSNKTDQGKFVAVANDSKTDKGQSFTDWLDGNASGAITAISKSGGSPDTNAGKPATTVASVTTTTASTTTSTTTSTTASTASSSDSAGISKSSSAIMASTGSTESFGAPKTAIVSNDNKTDKGQLFAEGLGGNAGGWATAAGKPAGDTGNKTDNSPAINISKAAVAVTTNLASTASSSDNKPKVVTTATAPTTTFDKIGANKAGNPWTGPTNDTFAKEAAIPTSTPFATRQPVLAADPTTTRMTIPATAPLSFRKPGS
jgi:hypothetical protein